MSTSFSTDLLLKKLDRVKPDLKPLPMHYIASQDQHTRELYATMLAAVMLAKGQVTEPETRLFGMLLQSMKIEATTAKFFELAYQLDENKIKDFVGSIKTTLLGEAFLLDAFILSRLEGNISESHIYLLSELCDLYGFKREHIGCLVNLCNYALGVGGSEENILDDLPNYKNFLNSKINPIVDELWTQKEQEDFSLGVWTDLNTGLVWSRVKLGQTWDGKKVVGDAQSEDWDKALSYCQSLKLGGFSDWRLPRKEELNSLRAVKNFPPVLISTNSSSSSVFGKFGTVFKEKTEFWTICEYEDESNYVYTVDFEKNHDTRSYVGDHYSPGKNMTIAVRGKSKLKFSHDIFSKNKPKGLWDVLPF